MQITDCVCETFWDIHKIFNVFESQVWKAWFSSSRIDNYGCQEKYLVYSGEENNSGATKKTKALCPYVLFGIKKKTEIILNLCFTLVKTRRVEKRRRQRRCRRFQRNIWWSQKVWNIFDDEWFKGCFRISREIFEFILII